MKLSEWKTFDEKKSRFRHEMIDSSRDLKMILNRKFGEVYFRGVPEARFKLFSSVQRAWIEQELDKRFDSIDQYVDCWLSKIREYKLLREIIKSRTNQNVNDWSYLSYLRHYGAPVPLIDFSMDLNVALYFAVLNASYESSDNPIDNYISLYMIERDNDNAIFEGSRIKLLCDELKMINSLDKESGDDSVDEDIQKAIEDSCKLSYKTGMKIQRMKEVSTGGSCSLVKKERSLCLDDFDSNSFTLGILSNDNIIAQRGVFFITENLKSLEENFVEESEINSESLKNFRTLKANDSYKFERIRCWDIHKSLIPMIKQHLQNNGVSENTIFPNGHREVEKINFEIMSNI